MAKLSYQAIEKILLEHRGGKWMKTIAREYWHSIHTVRKYVRLNKAIPYVNVVLEEDKREDVDTTIFMVGIWLLITVPLLLLYFLINV